ncbi:hypothetical protein AC1031_014778 [Aphanomyces cochlioides]|nr:hypothetical protein AC1031_014778 [Aphanomyces cochlioides]
MRVRFTPIVPDEVKKVNARSRRARAQDKRMAVGLLISSFKATPPRRLLSRRDARKRGCYGAERPIVVTGSSKIECAGAGVFVCVDLLAGTTYDGEIVFQDPQEPSYTIGYDFGATPAHAKISKWIIWRDDMMPPHEESTTLQCAESATSQHDVLETTHTLPPTPQHKELETTPTIYDFCVPPESTFSTPEEAHVAINTFAREHGYAVIRLRAYNVQAPDPQTTAQRHAR